MSERHHRPNEPHLIWSDYWHAWFRPEAKGYTDDIAQAGVFRGRGVEETRERKVYFDEAERDLDVRRMELREKMNHLDEIQRTLKLFVAEEPDT